MAPTNYLTKQDFLSVSFIVTTVAWKFWIDIVAAVASGGVITSFNYSYCNQ